MPLRIVVCLIVSAMLAGCAGRPSDDGSAHLQIVVAMSLIDEVVRAVGGEQVELRSLIEPGVEPHEADMSVKALEALEGADQVFVLGHGFQPDIERVLPTIGVPSAYLLDGVALAAADDTAHSGGSESSSLSTQNIHEDPHVWLDPSRLGQMVTQIEHILSTLDSAHAGEFSDRAGAYVKSLSELGASMDASTKHCSTRVLVTNHRAFHYLADRLGLTQLAITGNDPESEPSAQDLDRIAAQAKAGGAATVFSEAGRPADLAELIAREIGATTAELDPIETMTQDQLDRHETYLSIQRKNLDAIVAGLGCS